MKCFLLSLCLSLLMCGCLEGPTGPAGTRGATGPSLEVQVKTGTILSSNYTTKNPQGVSIPLASSGSEPTVLFFGIQTANGVYVNFPFVNQAVIWGGTNPDFVVPGTRGWYAIFPDQVKSLLNANYQIKFVQ